MPKKTSDVEVNALTGLVVRVRLTPMFIIRQKIALWLFGAGAWVLGGRVYIEPWDGA